MVYASTKIKKTAAMAYDEEQFENDQFTILKPEGFIIPVEFERNGLFEAYTKDFGVDEGGDIRKASAVVRFHPDTTCERLGNEVGGIEVGVGEADNLTLTEESDLRGAAIIKTHRLRGSNGGVYHLQIDALDDGDTIVPERVSLMADSFKLR